MAVKEFETLLKFVLKNNNNNSYHSHHNAFPATWAIWFLCVLVDFCDEQKGVDREGYPPSFQFKSEMCLRYGFAYVLNSVCLRTIIRTTMCLLLCILFL